MTSPNNHQSSQDNTIEATFYKSEIELTPLADEEVMIYE